jgi:SAM-dependent methyltransferase
MHPGAQKQAAANVLAKVGDYYDRRLAQFGPVPRGVDWKDGESQQRRFEQLLAVCRGREAFTINDHGCGYAGLFDYLSARHAAFVYHGFDISPAMIAAAEDRLRGRPNATFSVASTAGRGADYTVASGIFNVRLDTPEPDWLAYILDVLSDMGRNSGLGFAFNCLTSYADRDHMRADLYYADPSRLFDHCKRNFSPHVALLHDYGLYEFTIVVRKEI